MQVDARTQEAKNFEQGYRYDLQKAKTPLEFSTCLQLEQQFVHVPERTPSHTTYKVEV